MFSIVSWVRNTLHSNGLQKHKVYGWGEYTFEADVQQFYRHAAKCDLKIVNCKFNTGGSKWTAVFWTVPNSIVKEEKKNEE